MIFFIVLGSFLAGAICASLVAYRLGWDACEHAFPVIDDSADVLEAEFVEVKR